MAVGSFGPRVGAGRSVQDVKALIATADKRIADAVLAEAAVRAATEAQAAAHRHASEALTTRELALKAERGRHESNVIASTAQLEGMLAEATQRQQRAVQAEQDNAVLSAGRASELRARAAELDAYHASLNDRADGLTARERALTERIEAANRPKLGWLKRVTRRLMRKG